MLNHLKAALDSVKGRLITDLNLLGVAALLWIVDHQGASVLPLIALLPHVLQPVAGWVAPLLVGVVVQYAIIQTRTVAGTKKVEATHIGNVLEADILELLKSPALLTVLKQIDAVAKPMVLEAMAKEAPALEPIAAAVIAHVEQAAGLAEGGASGNLAGGEDAQPPIGTGPVVAAPATASDTAA